MKKESLIKTILVGRSPRRTLIRAVSIALFCFLIFKFFLIPVRIHGESMEPTYRNGSVNFVNTLYYRSRPLKRGDVVAIAIGSGRRCMYLKRIVGLPGERLSFRKGVLFINGKGLSEPCLTSECDWNMAEVLIGPYEYFVVGDNRTTPIETHEKGRVSRGRIVGKPLW